MKVRILCAGVLAAVMFSVPVHHSGEHVKNVDSVSVRQQVQRTPLEQGQHAAVATATANAEVSQTEPETIGAEMRRNLSSDAKAPQPESTARQEKPAVPSETVPATPKDIAKAKAAQMGWVGSEWNALEDLWHKESGWKPDAKNPSSGACGIPQAYPCTKIPNPKSVESQIDWGLEYIADRYDKPSKALAFWKYEAPKHNGANWY